MTVLLERSKTLFDQTCQQCTLCQRHNKQVVRYNKLHFEASLAPMKFISMDLIGEFHPPSSKGNRYALTVICMYTGFVFCIPLKTKSPEDVVQAYIDRVYSQFRGSEKVLTDNGTEFKNKLINEVCEQLGVKHKIYSPPYRPQSNGRIESFHYFLKACISKHITLQIEWDDVIPLACAAYNFYQMNTQKKVHSFLCLEEMQFYLSINYYSHRCNIWAMMRISYQCKRLTIFMR